MFFRSSYANPSCEGLLFSILFQDWRLHHLLKQLCLLIYQNILFNIQNPCLLGKDNERIYQCNESYDHLDSRLMFKRLIFQIQHQYYFDLSSKVFSEIETDDYFNFANYFFINYLNIELIRLTYFIYFIFKD